MSEFLNSVKIELVNMVQMNESFEREEENQSQSRNYVSVYSTVLEHEKFILNGIINRMSKFISEKLETSQHLAPTMQSKIVDVAGFE